MKLRAGLPVRELRLEKVVDHSNGLRKWGEGGTE